MKYMLLFLLFLSASCSFSQEESTEKSAVKIQVAPEKDRSKEEVVFGIPQQEAQFPGGHAAYNSFIVKHLKYPKTSIEKDEQGKVYVRFIVDIDGSIKDVTVERGISEALDAEAVRLVKLMPNWIPAEESGKAVASKYLLPFTFRIQ